LRRPSIFSSRSSVRQREYRKRIRKEQCCRGFVDQGHKVRRIALGNVSYKKLNDPEIVAAAIAQTAAWPKDLYAIEALGDAAPTDPASGQSVC